MDFKLSPGSGLDVQIIERPGKWMSPEKISKLSSSLVEIASHTLEKGDLNYGVFSSDPKTMEQVVITLITRSSDGKPIAFNSLTIMDVEMANTPIEVLHLGLVMIDPNEQSRGLSWILYGLTCILFFFRRQLRSTWITNVTQVPAIVGMVSETFSQIYPVPGNAHQRTLKHLLLAREIMNNHRHVFGVGVDAKFDEDRFVIMNAYTGGSDNLKKTFTEAPKHRKEIFNDFCEEQLNYNRGDDVLQIGKIDLNATRKYLLNSVPRRSLLSLLLVVTFIVLQKYILPLTYWFDTSRDWGILRRRNDSGHI